MVLHSATRLSRLKLSTPKNKQCFNISGQLGSFSLFVYVVLGRPQPIFGKRVRIMSDFIGKFHVIQYEYSLYISKPSKSAIFEKF